ncbi:PREDICTED: uncharacterized protein LOC104612961 [Nelumbo nucifera]|uniref:RING-type E3 ubiquitin transferase n=2 Tax=Nelumbo nucifera TaxID=4432 RepID=A0A1U8BP48_NELNU|nr:PREDICTED: uncharacterized protein LOC104612961 [Nelumbo nucifera]XP_010278934.1 PREDICTED: uncharacterized protein LOC104612961 [Nelumbo nucifera]DAD38554.1 TPA_asm: hypothetical protein HUJ06_012876 [Nelumbo nucifera]
MDAESHNIPLEDETAELSQMNSSAVVNHSDQMEAHCGLCQRIFYTDNEVSEDPETINVCRDCKAMFLEDLEMTIRESHQRRPPRGRRARYSRSSESIEDLFSQQFSHLINLVRHNQHTVPISTFEHGTQLIEGDAAATGLRHASSHTTPSGSRRWRRVLSDNESEGFDNYDSVFGESESNVSFSWNGVFHGESDAISFSAYGGDSDISVDGNGFLDREIFIQPDDGSNINSDTDIDPMHAGPNYWDSDDEDVGDVGWEGDGFEENTIETRGAEGWVQNAVTRSPGENDGPMNWLRGIPSPESGGIHWRIHESRRTYMGRFGDYLDSRGFEELLDQLAQSDNSRQGAPPAAASFVDSLPRIVVNEEQEKGGGLVCAICKDSLPIGTESTQLPCLHFYHPSCILPWLSARNSCPLCRYELPTDDKDYEEKRNAASRTIGNNEIQQQDPSEDGSSDVSTDCEEDETHEAGLECATVSSTRGGGRGRWFFLATAPIFSLVGIALVLWFRNSHVEGGRRGHCGFQWQHGQQVDRSSGRSFIHDQRENRKRRWWSFF